MAQTCICLESTAKAKEKEEEVANAPTQAHCACQAGFFQIINHRTCLTTTTASYLTHLLSETHVPSCHFPNHRQPDQTLQMVLLGPWLEVQQRLEQLEHALWLGPLLPASIHA
jgi:hypothetical protein